MILRFAGFEFDQQRLELRGPDGEAIKLRPKTFDMLTLFIANAGQVLSKQDLMEAVWPNVHVGEDSLFQCIREIRTALGDDQRQMIKLVSGRGYRFEVEVSSESAGIAAEPQATSPASAANVTTETRIEPEVVARRLLLGRRGATALATMAGLVTLLGLTIAATIFRPEFLFDRTLQTAAVVPVAGAGNDSQITQAAPQTAADGTVRLIDGLADIAKSRSGRTLSTVAVTPDAVAGNDSPVAQMTANATIRLTDGLAEIANIRSGRTPPTVAVMPIADAGDDSQIAQVAASVTILLTDGLAGIANIRVAQPPSEAAPASPQATSGRAAPADFVLNGKLQKSERSWELRARLTRTATSEVVWTTAVSVAVEDSDLQLQQSRLAAGIGHSLAVRINAILNSDVRPAAAESNLPSGSTKVVIEQANASIMQTTRERFATAQTMLEKALAADPDNVDLEIALAALQLRGIQMVWYAPQDSIAAETNARSTLERALRAKPNYIPVLEAYCRFLNATNEFAESLVACAKTLVFDPWDGMALYHMGLAHIQLGRFEDALATFRQADRFDTPQVSRWTWLLGAGWSYVMMGRNEEALPWLQRSIAITPASGRPLMLLAAAYWRLGRLDEAKAALAEAMKLRPGATAINVALPRKIPARPFSRRAKGFSRRWSRPGCRNGDVRQRLGKFAPQLHFVVATALSARISALVFCSKTSRSMFSIVSQAW